MQRSVKITYIFFPNTVENYHVVTPCEFSICYTIYPLIFTRFKYLNIIRKLYSNSLFFWIAQYCYNWHHFARLKGNA